MVVYKVNERHVFLMNKPLAAGVFGNYVGLAVQWASQGTVRLRDPSKDDRHVPIFGVIVSVGTFSKAVEIVIVNEFDARSEKEKQADIEELATRHDRLRRGLVRQAAQQCLGGFVRLTSGPNEREDAIVTGVSQHDVRFVIIRPEGLVQPPVTRRYEQFVENEWLGFSQITDERVRSRLQAILDRSEDLAFEGPTVCTYWDPYSEVTYP